MARLLILNKPFHVLSQFTDEIEQRCTLANFIHEKGIYPAGRLDYDSEGLLLLTDNGRLQHQISHPIHKLPKTYWAQVEGIPSEATLNTLTTGVMLNDGLTLPAQATLIDEPQHIWPRQPPIRQRQHIPTHWLKLTIYEGRNRQVRRMTAAVGHPTLRLIRASIGEWTLKTLAPGEWYEETISIPEPPIKRPYTPPQKQRTQHNRNHRQKTNHRQT